MKPLRQAIDDYISSGAAWDSSYDACPRVFGVRRIPGAKSALYVTTELAMEWAMQPADHQPSDWAQRLSFVRVFARHWHATDPRTEIPPTGLLRFGHNVPALICIRNRRFKSCWQWP
jgi:hypothetical protein